MMPTNFRNKLEKKLQIQVKSHLTRIIILQKPWENEMKQMSSTFLESLNQNGITDMNYSLRPSSSRLVE